MKIFNAYSEYYDLLYNDKNYGAEVDYVSSLIQLYAKNANTILELGCGTGLHACILAKLGYNIHGIDRSISMLDKALERRKYLENDIAEKTSFEAGDICTYQSQKKFDIVVSLFHVMSYMETNDHLAQAMETAKAHLNPEGLFIFDCWHGPAVLKDRPVSRTKFFENTDIYVKRVSIPEMSPERNIVDVHFDILMRNKNSNEEIHLQEAHKMRYLFPDEITTLLKTADFSLLHSEEWLTKNSLSENTWNACYICKKNS
jgi:SAM-dependent methyltransferase